jgi:hypothetical protein
MAAKGRGHDGVGARQAGVATLGERGRCVGATVGRRGGVGARPVSESEWQ